MKQIILCVFLLIHLLNPLQSQTVKRVVISFYGINSSNLKGTSGQVSNGLYKINNNDILVGFQQPLSYPNNVRLNVLSDTVLCSNDKLVFKTGKCIFYKWFRNDTEIVGQNTDSLLVIQTGTYKVVGSDGIVKFDTSKTIKVSFLSKPNKPLIKSYSSDTTVCFYDTLVLSSLNTFDRYKWSTGDTTINAIIKSAGYYFLQSGVRAGTSNNYCYSDSSNIITARKNITPIPSIIRISDDLVSSLSQNYRWLKNNLLLPLSTSNSFHLLNKGLYRVETSIDNFCWSISKDYNVQTDLVSSNQKDFELVAFPNPTNGIFFLQIKLERRFSGFVAIQIADVSGVVKWSFNKFVFNEQVIKIPINLNFNKGLYSVQVSINGFKTKAIQVIGQ